MRVSTFFHIADREMQPKVRRYDTHYSLHIEVPGEPAQASFAVDTLEQIDRAIEALVRSRKSLESPETALARLIRQVEALDIFPVLDLPDSEELAVEWEVFKGRVGDVARVHGIEVYW